MTDNTPLCQTLDSLEYKLLIALTHPFPDQQQDQVANAIANHSFDWNHFLSLVLWHRLTPQIYRNLIDHRDSIPEHTFHQLRTAALNCQRRSLHQSAWLVKLTKLFDCQQIRFIVLKGVALSQLLYTDSARREAKDLDILIDKADLTQVEHLLVETCGFIRQIPSVDATEEEISYLNRFKKDRVYVHPRDKTMIEFHWRFLNEKPLLAVPFSELIQQSLPLQFHNQTISVLGEAHFWLYQSIHGTYSGWYRLHWLTDIAEMLVQHPVEWDMLLELADKHYCKRCLIEAVALAGQVYQLPIPETIHVQMHNNWRQQISLSLAMRLLAKAQILTPLIFAYRVMLWAPKRYYIYYFLYRIVQTSYSSTVYEHQHPVRRILYCLIRPFALVIRRLL